MELTRDKIIDFVQYRLRKTSPYAAKRDIQYISSAFNWGIQKKYLVSNSCIGIKRPRLPEKQPLYFTNEEFNKLLTATSNDDLKDVILFAVNTGLRQMELLRLKWEQINIDEKILSALRHTFASWLVQRGATIYDVSKLLGHSTIKSTEIYAHLRVDELRDKVEKLN